MYAKRASLAGLAFQVDGPLHGLDQLLDDGQSETYPAVRAAGRFICLAKWFEDPGLILMGNADPCIFHLHNPVSIPAFEHSNYDAALLGEFDGIDDQVR